MNFKCVYKELVSVKDLRPHPKNTNKHTKEQIDRLAKLIEYQGQRSSLVVSTRSGFLVKGHATLQAIKKLKWEKAAVDYQDFDSDDQELAYLTSDNAIASWASLDMGMINDQLKDLGPDFDIEWLGLESFGLDGPEVEHCDPDDAPEPKADARTVLGDLYELGGHRLLCGDSTSIDEVEKLMGGQKADMVFTDPPYNVASDSINLAKNVSKSMKDLSEAEWD